LQPTIRSLKYILELFSIYRKVDTAKESSAIKLDMFMKSRP
jgi:hypothetical protein